MANLPQPFLFGWAEIDAESDLARLRLVLAGLPDEPLVAALERLRGKGRDDYPVRPTWNSVLAGIVFQHPSVASLRRELRRNGELRALCGFDPFAGERAVPTDDAYSRFLELLMDKQPQLEDLFDTLLSDLGRALPDLGRKLAVDSKAIPSFGRPIRKELLDTIAGKDPDHRRDNDADWGVKTKTGVRADGTAWEKVTRWFGYKLHLIVDSTHELPLCFELTQASAGDSPELLPLVEALENHHAELAGRAEQLAADKAYDSADNKRSLYDEHLISPLIDHRQMWKDEPGKPRPLLADRVDVFLYDELGQVFCQPLTERRGQDQLREMAFVGFEQDRLTLKYHCPAAYFGFECEWRKQCDRLAPKGVGKHGRTLRVPLETDRRIFTPIARHSPKWKRAYDRRTSVERVNSRLDRVLGFELHTIRGLKKMKLRVTLALVVMLAMALGRIRIGQMDQLRSLTAPVHRAA